MTPKTTCFLPVFFFRRPVPVLLRSEPITLSWITFIRIVIPRLYPVILLVEHRRHFPRHRRALPCLQVVHVTFLPHDVLLLLEPVLLRPENGARTTEPQPADGLRSCEFVVLHEITCD